MPVSCGGPPGGQKHDIYIFEITCGAETTMQLPSLELRLGHASYIRHASYALALHHDYQASLHSAITGIIPRMPNPRMSNPRMSNPKLSTPEVSNTKISNRGELDQENQLRIPN